MKLRTLLAALALAAASATAFAMHCPLDMKAIDEALAKKPSLSAEQLANVKKYRAEGEALHNAGKHQESVDTLAKARKILGI
jgi:cytochrome c556